MYKRYGYVVGVVAGLWILAVSCMPQTASANLALGSLFQDHMVLQRDMKVPVWGTACAGVEIQVEFGEQAKRTVADPEGKWLVNLDPLAACYEPASMLIKAGANEEIRLIDIVVGEVWICSGQSNMQFPVSAVPEVVELQSKQENLRAFTVERTVAFTEQDNVQGNWSLEGPNSAVGFSFAYFLEEAAGVPVGIILSAWGSTSIEAWMPRDMKETVPHFKTMMDAFDSNTEAQEKIKASLTGPKPWSREEDIFMRRQSNIVYNAMMKPLAPFACRGLVWYQGERNAQSMFGEVDDPWYSRNSGMLKYGDVLKKWIQRYRREWGREDLNFFVVMLPGLGQALKSGPEVGAESPIAHSWAWMRESQLQARKLDHVAVVNTIDLGDAKNVHPKDKLPIGKRLALLAARDILGQAVEADGPIMKRIQRKGNSLIVDFDHADGLKTRDGKSPSAFWLSDNSKEWVKAEAKIDGTSVVLQSPELKKPLYVRYAFAGFPKVNLVNAAGLPAYPFRTDSFAP